MLDKSYFDPHFSEAELHSESKCLAHNQKSPRLVLLHEAVTATWCLATSWTRRVLGTFLRSACLLPSATLAEVPGPELA